MSIESRLQQLEQRKQFAQAWRTFTTTDGEWYLPTRAGRFDYRRAVAGLNGKWPADLRAELISRAELDAIEADCERIGMSVLVVRYAPKVDEAAE